MFIDQIFEVPEILPYLETRNLVRQYKKAKTYLLMGHYSQVGFKLRQPREKGIYEFRINQKFRAFGIIKDREMRIFAIDDHQ